jgi:hypothetical protein
MEEKWTVEELLFDGLPVIDWVGEKMNVVASEHDAANKRPFISAKAIILPCISRAFQIPRVRRFSGSQFAFQRMQLPPFLGRQLGALKGNHLGSGNLL